MKNGCSVISVNSGPIGHIPVKMLFIFAATAWAVKIKVVRLKIQINVYVATYPISGAPCNSCNTYERLYLLKTKICISCADFVY